MTTTLLHHAWLPTHLRSRGIGLRTHWRFLIHRPHRGARDISSVCIALAFRLVVRLCASMAHIVHMSVSVDTTAPCSICLLGVCLRCFSVPKWKNIRTCGCLMAPEGGITLTTRVFRTPHHTLSSSCNLVRAHLPLCRYWPPHGSHMVQRLQALCLAHKLHTKQSVHKFRRAPLAPSEVTLCQPRSLRPPRNSHLLNSWSVASTHSQVRMVPTCTTPNDLLAATLSEAATQLSFAAFLERCIFVNASPLPQLPVPTPSLDAATQTFSHTAAPRTFLRNSRSGSSWLHLLLLTFAALPVLDQSPRYILMRLCRRLYTASQLTMPRHNKRSRSSSSDVSSPTTL